MILVVEDSTINQKALLTLLQKENYSVRAVSNSKDCFTAIEEKHPELILLDIMLPGENGFEICKKLKSNEKVKKIPVIFITSIADTEAVVTGFKLGAVDYVTKPFRGQELLARVETHLELSKAKRTILSSEETIRNLKNLLPVCSYCGVMRDEEGEWLSMKDYFTKNLEKSASHSICPSCMKEYHPQIAQPIDRKYNKGSL